MVALSVAEQLLVLISRSDGSANGYGRKLDVLVKLDVALAGALLSELVADGYAALVDKKVQATAARRDQPEHPRLRAALAIVAKKPRTPEATLRALAKRRLRKSVRRDLVGSGVMTRRRRRWRPSRYELVESDTRDAVNEKVRAVIVDGARPERDTVLLIPVVFATGLCNRILVDEDADEVGERLAQLTEKDWLVEGLKRAVVAAKVQAMVALLTEVVIPVIAVATQIH